MNSGTRMGTRAFAFSIRFPLSKSAPRAFWADMILSVSSISVGINRSAIVIIIASSCTGKCSLCSGFISRSSPSVSSIGVVV